MRSGHSPDRARVRVFARLYSCVCARARVREGGGYLTHTDDLHQADNGRGHHVACRDEPCCDVRRRLQKGHAPTRVRERVLAERARLRAFVRAERHALHADVHVEKRVVK